MLLGGLCCVPATELLGRSGSIPFGLWLRYWRAIERLRLVHAPMILRAVLRLVSM